MSGKAPEATPARNETEWVAQSLISPSGFNVLRNLEEIAKIFLGWASVTLEVFIRQDFGERYLTVGRILTGYLFIRLCLGIVNFRNSFFALPTAQPPVLDTLNGWYINCFAVLALVHLARIYFRNRAGIPWYSRSHGVSLLSFLIPLSGYRLSDWVLYRFVEPGLCFAVAWYVMPWLMPEGSFTRNWLILASLGLFLHNNLAYNATRNRYLDMVDSEITSRYLHDIRQGQKDHHTSLYQTAGYTAVPIPRIAKEVLPPDIAATVQETIGRDGG